MTVVQRDGASFRDPSGFVFKEDGVLYRQVNKSYKKDYEALNKSGLYSKLVEAKLLIPHEEVERKLSPNAYKVIKPELVPFVSYPYEWSFGQLKDAALATLQIQNIALAHGMSLKDASAYNIQFVDGKPLMIDTLSFEIYPEGKPWVAYKQFCQHFLAPLTLMSKTDVRLSQLLRVYIDGIPLDLASNLLGAKSYLKPSTAMHIHMHAKAQSKHSASASEKPEANNQKLSAQGMKALISSLEGAIRAQKWHPHSLDTTWGDYYDEHSYSKAGFNSKKDLVRDYLVGSKTKTVWDLGGNSGVFSRIAAGLGMQAACLDDDVVAVERNYIELKKSGETKLLPLVIDLTNPSSSMGWAHRERMSLADRGPVDTVMALALVHHLAIAGNLPLGDIADYFAKLGKHLIIEFVPKPDSMVRRLLASREDIFPDYTEAGFEAAFATKYKIVAKQQVTGSKRIMYLMRAKA